MMFFSMPIFNCCLALNETCCRLQNSCGRMKMMATAVEIFRMNSRMTLKTMQKHNAILLSLTTCSTVSVWQVFWSEHTFSDVVPSTFLCKHIKIRGEKQSNADCVRWFRVCVSNALEPFLSQEMRSQHLLSFKPK